MNMGNVSLDRSVAVDHSRVPARLTTAERLHCLLALSRRQTELLFSGDPVAINLDALAAHSGLDVATLRRLVRSRELLESLRLNPNRLTRSQVERIPGLSGDRVQRVLGGRPYYSMHDLELASGVSRQVLSQLVHLERFEMLESAGSRPLRLTPVPGKYLLRSRTLTPDADRTWTLGYAATPCDPSASVLLLVSRDAQAARPFHELKAEFGERLHPVFRDDLGFERYFSPGSLDIWFRRDVGVDAVRRVLQFLGLRVRTAYAGADHYVVDLVETPDDLDVIRATLAKAAEAWRRPEVLFVEPEQIGIDGLGVWQVGLTG